ncbi:MAG TPA: FAD-binding oxidoreductase [Gammaproteobacteria bacterium]|nr:FAD-binding oxidoreductase [Gammaproteobacteria bacterium]
MSAQVGGTSWGRYPPAQQQAVWLRDRSAPLPAAEGSVLPWGNGRSYGDVCLNDGGNLLHTRGLDHFIEFDEARGVLRCEAGLLLSEILDFCVPRGWFLPVTPGTRLVTVGGAIANDVHGKNHHRAGSFGCHLRAFELLRSDGSRRRCSPDENADWFAATIGGLGLTGVITWAELALKRIPGPWLDTHSERFETLDEFFVLSARHNAQSEYTVAWLDCSRAGGRGLFQCANHANAGPNGQHTGHAPPRRLAVPFTPPVALVNRLSVRTFNALHWRRHGPAPRQATVHHQPWLYPLDGIGDWNRIYGRRGFVQYQSVVPPAAAPDAIKELLRRIAASGQGSFLSVLKQFGPQRSPGLLSFPREGTTLALDFPMAGDKTLRLLDALDEVVAGAGGAVYPAKDARLPAARFRQYFPGWEAFAGFVDPRFSSGFWRRVSQMEQAA